MEELLFRYNPWWENKVFSENFIRREESLLNLKNCLNSKHIIFLTGLRRVGKTTLMKLLIKELITNHNVDPKHIFYISLDDYRLIKFSLLSIIEEFRKIQRLKSTQKIYLFLDEIAYKSEMEIQLKNLYDLNNVKIYASSSSASILKNKKHFLTGRNIIIEVLPLDFQEYLLFKNIHIKKSDSHLIDSYFEEFLFNGGMPEFVLTGNIEILKELVDDIIMKDIAVINNIKYTQLLKDFFLLLMERAGKQASINKLANILSISPDTASRYLKMFHETYLISLVNRLGKTNEKLLSPKKIYAADLGIRTLFTGSRDKGSLFENYVFLKIKNKNPFYIYQNGIELDFFTDDKHLLKIKYHSDLNEKQKKLFKEYSANKKTVIKNIGDMKKLY